MKIHVSEPCKNLLPAQFHFELRDEPELKEKVGGLTSYFLTSKDGRQPLKEAVIRALMPSDMEKPKGMGNDEKKDDKKDKKKDDAPKVIQLGI